MTCATQIFDIGKKIPTKNVNTLTAVVAPILTYVHSDTLDHKTIVLLLLGNLDVYFGTKIIYF